MVEVCGSNVFGQWFSKDLLFYKFRRLHQKTEEESGKLILVRWSYNLFLVENSYVITGHVNGNDYNTMIVQLPNVHKDHDYCLESNILISGNDYKLVIVDTRSNEIWIHNFTTQGTWEWSQIKLKFDVVTTVEVRDNLKKTKTSNHIKKVILTNTINCLLSSDGDLYEYPNKIDTSKCIGIVCDFDYGHEHGILLTDAGVVYTWGNGRRCQLGHGSLLSLEEPEEVEALSGIKITQVQAGGWHCMALSEFGDVYTWGWNDTGQLGIKFDVCGSKEQSETSILNSYSVPKLLDIFDENNDKLDINIIQIACGNRHSAILLDDFSIWTTGSNKYGQLGVGQDLEVVNCFKKVFTSNKLCQIMCGPWSTVVKQE